MKQLFFINDNKKKYNAKSISNYKKKDLIKALEQNIINNDYESSLYFTFEMVMSGYFNELWLIIFTILSEYIHILNPDLPFYINEKYEIFIKIRDKFKKRKVDLLKMRDLLDIQNNFIFIIKNLINSRKKHISYFIHSIYSNQKKHKHNPASLIKLYRHLFNKIINNKLTYAKTNYTDISEFYAVLGKLFIIDSELDYNMCYPYNINLYHHKKSKIHDGILNILWNISLNTAKINKNILSQIVSLYKIYNYKITYKLEKETFHILHSLLYFTYNIQEMNILNVVKNDIYKMREFYINVQNAINTRTIRIDMIHLNQKVKGSTKKIKNNNNIISMKSVVPSNIIPINKDITKIKDEKQEKPEEPKQEIEEIKEEEISFFNIIKRNKPGESNDIIEITTNNEKKSKDDYDIYQESLFNFDIIPTYENTIKEEYKNYNEHKQVKLKKDINNISKPLHSIQKL
jgi:hypothetical protein